MDLPIKFTFVHGKINDDMIYTAEQAGDDFQVTWNIDGEKGWVEETSVPRKEVKSYIKSGLWMIVDMKEIYSIIDKIQSNIGKLEKIIETNYELIKEKGYQPVIMEPVDGCEHMTSVHALNKDQSVVVSGIARCNPDDVFIQEIGEALALQRILNAINKE